MSCVAVAGCSFPGSSGGGDGPPIDRADGPIEVIDGRRSDARPIDARPPDASLPDAGFVPALCPSGYNLGSTTSPNSRYRVIDTQAPFATQHADCSDDSAAGWTHLVTFGSQEEAQDAADMILAQFFYVGLAQPLNQPSPGAGWAWFDGSTTITAWETVLAQPDDQNGSENNVQNLAGADAGNGVLQDVGGQASYEAICECDGIPIDPTVASWLP